MKIDAIYLRELRLPLVKPFVTSFGPTTDRRILLVEIKGDHISFLQKYQMIHTDWLLSLPPRYRERLTPESSVSCLSWEDSFSYEEVEVLGTLAQEAELRRFAQALCPSPGWLIAADAVRRRMASFVRRGFSWCKRVLN